MTRRRFIGIALLVLGLLGMGAAGLAFLGQRHSYDTYVRVSATLVAPGDQPAASGGKPTTAPTPAAPSNRDRPWVRFRTSDRGEVVAPLDTGPFDMTPRVRSGRVRVRYDRDNPQRVVLDDSLAMYGPSLVVAGLAAVLLILSGWLRRGEAKAAGTRSRQPRPAQPQPAPAKGRFVTRERNAASAPAAAPSASAAMADTTMVRRDSQGDSAAVRRGGRDKPGAVLRNEDTVWRSPGGAPGIVVVLVILGVLVTAALLLLGGDSGS